MYIPFKIKKKEIKNIKDLIIFNHAEEVNKQIVNNDVIEIFKNKLNIDNGYLSGDFIKESWFPTGKHYDFFISYSHNDEDEALGLVHFLQKKGLTCFIDADCWNCADKLLKIIDDKYCRKDSHYYDYQKRNYSTSLVHAMLTMAITEAIDKSSFAIFIESENSMCLDYSDISKYTLSPWIYEEIQIISHIRRSIPIYNDTLIKSFSEGCRLNESNDLNVVLNIPTDKLIRLNAEVINNSYGYGSKWLDSLLYNTFKMSYL